MQACTATPCSTAAYDELEAQERFSLSQTEVAGIGTAVNLGGATDCQPPPLPAYAPRYRRQHIKTLTLLCRIPSYISRSRVRPPEAV